MDYAAFTNLFNPNTVIDQTEKNITTVLKTLPESDATKSLIDFTIASAKLARINIAGVKTYADAIAVTADQVKTYAESTQKAFAAKFK